MGQWIHRKPEPSNVRGFCIKCGKNPQKKRAGGKYRALCSLCDKKIHSPKSRRKAAIRHTDKARRPYRQHVKNLCEMCGFIPEHICQLDVDHIDGNHKNNALENLQTLCANCHRLKTFKERQIENP
jgi:5-methylcytosine-specific restriction endonuclease McrA